MRMWITHVCSHFMDVQEANRRLHSIADSDIISAGAGLRMDGLPALEFWDCVLETLSSKPTQGNLECHTRKRDIPSCSHSDRCVFGVN